MLKDSVDNHACVFVGRVHQTYRLTVDLTVGWLEGEGGGQGGTVPR